MTGNATGSAVEVELPPALVRLFPGATPQMRLSATNVGEAIDVLNQQWPGMRDRLVDSTPRIRRNIHVFVDGARASLDTPLAQDARVVIKTAMIG